MDLNVTLEVIFSLFSLTLLEVVLGIDNLIFISIVTSRLPAKKQKNARRFGLSLAWVTRLMLLASVIWIYHLTEPVLTIASHPLSWRDLFLILGGLFLLVKATLEIHEQFQESIAPKKTMRKYANVVFVVIQIALLDIIFSLDSILTAIGLTQQFWVMASAITIAIIAMLFASEPLSKFLNAYPTVKMLALSFLLLIGMVLIADGCGLNIPRAYVYFAVAFSVLVELLNNLIAKRRKQARVRKKKDPL